MLASTTREEGFEAGTPTSDGKQVFTLAIAQLAVSYFHDKLSIIVQSEDGKLMSGFLVNMKRHLGIDDNLKW